MWVYIYKPSQSINPSTSLYKTKGKREKLRYGGPKVCNGFKGCFDCDHFSSYDGFKGGVQPDDERSDFRWLGVNPEHAS